jgi:hypothetical protein
MIVLVRRGVDSPQKFDVYHKTHCLTASADVDPTPPAQQTTESAGYSDNGYGWSYMLSTINARNKRSAAIGTDPREELKRYLKAPREEGDIDPIKWWGVGYSYLAFNRH